MIREARIEDTQNLLGCQIQVLESLRGVLPIQFIEQQMRWLYRSDRKSALENAIKEKNNIILVAEEAESIVGFAQGRVNRQGTSWLAYMGVIPTYRRKGIGRELTKRYLIESQARNAHKVSLYTVAELRPAIKLYVELGFSKGDKIRRHKNVDLIEYSRSLK